MPPALAGMDKMHKLIWTLCLLAAAIVAGRQWSASGAESLDSKSQAGQGDVSEAAERLREGTRITEQSGRFQPAGDRLMFYLTESGQRLGTLENLNLERIATMVGDSPEPLEWTVSGTVTEFQGVNYLLIERAVLKTRLGRRSNGQK